MPAITHLTARGSRDRERAHDEDPPHVVVVADRDEHVLVARVLADEDPVRSTDLLETPAVVGVALRRGAVLELEPRDVRREVDRVPLGRIEAAKRRTDVELAERARGDRRKDRGPARHGARAEPTVFFPCGAWGHTTTSTTKSLKKDYPVRGGEAISTCRRTTCAP